MRIYTICQYACSYSYELYINISNFAGPCKLIYLKIKGYYFEVQNYTLGPPLWSGGQSFWLQIQRSLVRFPALPDFVRSTESTQPRDDN
jgi:hypothetical protein